MTNLVTALLVALFFSSRLSEPYWGRTYDPVGFGEALVCVLLIALPAKFLTGLAQARYLLKTHEKLERGTGPGRLRFVLTFYGVDLLVSILTLVVMSPILVVMFFTALGIPIAFCLMPSHLVLGWWISRGKNTSARLGHSRPGG